MYRLTEMHQSYIVVLTVVFSSLIITWQSAVASEESLSFEQLIGELENPKSDHCWDAINMLGSSGDKRAVPHLIKALEKDMKQRKGIAMAIIPTLGHLKDDRAVPLLIKALNNLDEDWLGREAAAVALGDIGSTQAVPYLIRAAWLPETRTVAIDALAGIGDSRATAVLLSALNEPEDPEAREAAINGLIKIGEPAVPALIDKLNIHSKEFSQNHERALVAMILGKIGDHRAIDPLTSALDDPSAEVLRSVETALECLTH